MYVRVARRTNNVKQYALRVWCMHCSPWIYFLRRRRRLFFFLFSPSDENNFCYFLSWKVALFFRCRHENVLLFSFLPPLPIFPSPRLYRTILLILINHAIATTTTKRVLQCENSISNSHSVCPFPHGSACVFKAITFFWMSVYRQLSTPQLHSNGATLKWRPMMNAWTEF